VPECVSTTLPHSISYASETVSHESEKIITPEPKQLETEGDAPNASSIFITNDEQLREMEGMTVFYYSLPCAGI